MCIAASIVTGSQGDLPIHGAAFSLFKCTFKHRIIGTISRNYEVLPHGTGQLSPHEKRKDYFNLEPTIKKIQVYFYAKVLETNNYCNRF